MLKLHAKQSGTGRDLILLHGLFGSLENLGAIQRQLSERFRTHALDLRNHGRSPHAPSMSYACQARDVLKYLDDQGLEHADLLGHSMGGKVAMTFALQYPDRCRRIVVADIAPVHYPPHHNEIFEGLSKLDPAQIRSRQEADQALQPYVPEVAVRQFLLKNLIRSGDGAFRWRLNLDVIMKDYESIMQGQHAEHPFHGPVLFLKGGISRYIQPGHRDTVLKLFPKASLREIPGTDHWLHAEKPELFSRLVLRFLEDGET